MANSRELFERLQGAHPGRFADGQLPPNRTASLPNEPIILFWRRDHTVARSLNCQCHVASRSSGPGHRTGPPLCRVHDPRYVEY
jgi:hypothetical protein